MAYFKILLRQSGYEDSLKDPIFLIIIFIIGILFLLLGLFFAWLYNHLKSGQNSYEEKFIHKSPFSILGFWGRNRMKIIVFFSALLILIGLSLVIILATGKMTPSIL